MKFVPHTGGYQKQIVTYQKMKEHIVFEIQKKFDFGASDIAGAIRDLEEFDFEDVKPERERSLLVDADDKAFEQATFDMEFKSEKQQFDKRKRAYEENKKKAFAWIFHTYCTKEMQVRLKEHPDFEGIIYNDPIELLKEIQIAMNQPMRAQYHPVTHMESLKRFLLCLLYTSPSPRDQRGSRMPSSA